MMLGRSRRIVEIVLGSAWVGMLILLTSTTGLDRGNPLSERPTIQLIWALLITTLGGLLLAERAYYVSVYAKGINWGPFKMGIPTISRLVVTTGVFLVLLGIVIGQYAIRRLITGYGF